MASSVMKGIIFDCFGVLYTDSKTSLRALVPADKQQDLSDVYLRNDYGYIDKATFYEMVSGLTGLTSQEVQSYIRKKHVPNQPLMSLITEQLHGQYKVGLLSNIGRGWIHDFFSPDELRSLFSEVVLSGEEGVIKPNPAIFTLTADRLGLRPEECLMIDDLRENCEGAELAGLHALQFTSNEQLRADLHQFQVM